MSHNSDEASPSCAKSLNARPIAALCVSGRSIYKHLPGVEAFDRRRGAMTFDANTPAVAHPPCRLWSKYLRGQAKSADPEAERELGRWCVRTVLRCGGVVEQPAGSLLWQEMNLPMPNDRTAGKGFFTHYVEQSWFGYASRKPTWLLIVGVSRADLPPMPFSLVKPRSGPLCLSAFGRSRTIEPFARWLCEVARRANPPG